MRWMWIIPGLLMALAAIGLIGVWAVSYTHLTLPTTERV